MDIYLPLLIPFKTCSCCGVSKEISLFNKKRSTKDGLQSKCRDCEKAWKKANPEKVKASRKAWAKANPEKVKAYNKTHYQANPEKKKAQSKAWKKANPEKARVSEKAWRKANPEKVKAYEKAYREANPEKVKAKVKAWGEANKEKINTKRRNRRKTDPEYSVVGNLRSRLYQAVNRIAKSASTKAASTKELLGCSEEFLMSYLESQFEDWMTWDNYGPDWHVDHIKPCASFDLTDPKQQEECFHWSNLQPLSASENMSKGDRIL